MIIMIFSFGRQQNQAGNTGGGTAGNAMFEEEEDDLYS